MSFRLERFMNANYLMERPGRSTDKLRVQSIAEVVSITEIKVQIIKVVA